MAYSFVLYHFCEFHEAGRGRLLSIEQAAQHITICTYTIVHIHRKKIGKCKIALISRNMYTTYAIVNSAAIDLTEAATALYCLLPS